MYLLFNEVLLLFVNRNQNEAGIRGGLKFLCELLRTASDEKVSLRCFELFE